MNWRCEMDGPLANEIRGDWSNVKGSMYHLIYALWLLICSNAESVEFYKGNDLLARPASPPGPEDVAAALPAIHADIGGVDEWIQLKSTRSAWPPSKLLEDNLLTNFICNALHSEAHLRPWRAHLVTEGEVSKASTEEFANNPEHHPKLAEALNRVCHDVHQRLSQSTDDPPDAGRIQTLALNILHDLASSESVSL